MLDTKAGWDELIRRHAPDAKVREAVLANPLYVNITSRFVHSHDYLAMEQLHELHASGRYDLIVVDTPPSRSALDVLDAPGRMKEFFESRLLRWLTVPYRSRLFTAASKPFYSVADRVLGSRFLQDIAEFFILFQAMEKRFVAHATRSSGCSAITAPRSSSCRRSRPRPPTRPPTWHARSASATSTSVRSSPTGCSRPSSRPRAPPTAPSASTPRPAARWPNAIAAEIDLPVDVVSSTLDAAASRFHDIALVATREAERRAELEGLAAARADRPDTRSRHQRRRRPAGARRAPARVSGDDARRARRAPAPVADGRRAPARGPRDA